MSFKGTLDFQHILQFDTEEVRLYYGYESKDVYVLPDEIGVATSNGKSELTITLVKSKHELSPVSLYGTLDMQLALVHPVAKAKEALKNSGNTATVIAASCTGGTLRLQPVNNTIEFPSELQIVVSADWNPVGPTRFLFRLDSSSVTLMKESLKNGSLLFKALAVLECKGLAPRLPLVIRFNPRDVLLEIHKTHADKDGRIQLTDTRNFFNRDAQLLPLSVEGDRKNELPGLFADAVTDIFLNRFAKPLPPDDTSMNDYYQLMTADDAGEGSFEWNLSQPTEIKRLLRLQMNPIKAAKQLADQPGGIESSIKEIQVPPLQTGFKYLSVSANLPAHRLNVLKAAVQIQAPPHVPVRMQALSETVNFIAPDDASDIVLRYSPAETLNYNYQPFMLVNTISGVKKIQGISASANKERLLLNVDQFNVQFLLLEATSDLLEIAIVRVSFREAGSTNKMEYQLDKIHPLVSICFPADDPLPEVMQIDAVSLASNAVIALPSREPASMRFGLHHFEQYGFHTVNVCCNFISTTDTVRLELLPEVPANDGQPGLIFLTPETRCKDWGYFADSPFLCNYRYRFKKEDGSVGEWSQLQSPLTPLIIDNADS